VLIVDDEPPILEVLQDILQDAGYAVIAACDGLTAYTLARKAHLAIVITDVMMPNMDGLTLCERLRGDPLTAHLPIIGMSAASHASVALRFTAFLTKPFDVDYLLSCIVHYVQPPQLPD
jgi:CheY-like chemotaxis protein